MTYKIYRIPDMEVSSKALNSCVIYMEVTIKYGISDK